MSMKRAVEVAVRLRPPNRAERYSSPCVAHDDQGITVAVAAGVTLPQSFAFDRVYGHDEGQADVYAESVGELVDSALQGSGGVVFAYGQTGSGKTHTMLGEVVGAQILPQTGVYLRVVADLLAVAHNRADVSDPIRIAFSAMEVYNDEPRDLLNQRAVVKLQDSGEPMSITTRPIEGLEDAVTGYKIAETCRTACSTQMNARSSRSHALFTLYVTQTITHPKRGRVERTARLSVVDLAGSERIKKSKVQGAALDEAKHINKSLSSLGKVMHDLNSGKGHVSFRDCKLTRLLQPCFTDPKSKVVLIVNISPSEVQHSETLSSLRFANCVKNIKATAMKSAQKADDEQIYLDRCKVIDELTADLRLADASVDGGHPFQGRHGSASACQAVLVARQRAKEEASVADIARIVDELVVETTTRQAQAEQAARERVDDAAAAVDATEAQLAKDAQKYSKRLESASGKLETVVLGKSEAKAKRDEMRAAREVLVNEETALKTEMEAKLAAEAALMSEVRAEDAVWDARTVVHDALAALAAGVTSLVNTAKASLVALQQDTLRGAWPMLAGLAETLAAGEAERAAAVAEEAARVPPRPLFGGIEATSSGGGAAGGVEAGAGVEEDSISVYTVSVVGDDPADSLGEAASGGDGAASGDEFMEGPADVLENMLKEVEEELADLLDPRLAAAFESHFDSSAEDDGDTSTGEEEEEEEETEDDDASVDVPVDPKTSASKYQVMKGLPIEKRTSKYAETRGLPARKE